MGLAAYWARNRFRHDNVSPFLLKKDTPTLLPKAVRCTLADAQEVSYAMSIAPDAVKYNGKFGMILFCMRWHDRLDVGLLLRYTGAEGRR